MNPTKWALSGLSLSVLLPALGTSIANVALPTLVEAFQASFSQVQWVVLAYLLAVTTLIVGAGRLGDMAGRRRLLLGGILVFTLASVLCAAAPTLGVLVAARAVQGAGAALMLALALALATEAAPAGETGRAMGLLGTMSALGTALGPSIGGALVAAFGWPSIFLVSLPPGVLAFVLVYRFLPADRPAEPRRFDLPGSLVLALMLTAYALALTKGAPLLLGLAALGLVVFVLVEAKAASPLIQLKMLREPRLAVGLATSLAVSTVVMATLVVGPFYLSGSLGLDPARVGQVLAVGPLVAALGGVPAGRLVDRFGTTPMTAAGLVGMVAGSMVLSLWLPGTVLAYVAPLAVITAGYALFQAANNTATLAGVASAQRGVVSGMLNLSRNLGLITGAAALGAVFAAAGLQATFGVSVALLVAALVLAAWGAVS